MDTQKEMNNIWIITAKEIKDNFKSLRFILIGIFYLMFALAITGITVALYYFVYKSMAPIGYFKPGDVLSWFGMVAFLLVLPAVIITADTISSEKKDRTIYQLLSKPVCRSSVIFGKYIGCLVTSSFLLVLSAVVAYVLTAILTGVYPAAGDLPGVLEAIASMVIILMVYVGIGILISTLTRNPLISIIGVIVVWIGLFMSSVIGKVIALASNAYMPEDYPIYAMVPICLDPTSHGLVDQIIRGTPSPVGISLWLSVVILCFYTAILLLASVVLFNRQDI